MRLVSPLHLRMVVFADIPYQGQLLERLRSGHLPHPWGSLREIDVYRSLEHLGESAQGGHNDETLEFLASRGFRTSGTTKH